MLFKEHLRMLTGIDDRKKEILEDYGLSESMLLPA
jgi:hypothetical protein